MKPAELHTLTGAYAMYALLGEEREEFECHLAACEACRQEVDELTATAGRLGLAMTTTPPAHLKASVLRQIRTVRQEPPHTPSAARTLVRPSRRHALARFALAACLAATAACGGIAVWQYQEANTVRGQVQTTQRQYQQLAEVLAAPDAKTTTGQFAGNATGTLVAARSRNQAVFLASGLSHPPTGKVYQLWFADTGTMRPAGLMDPTRTTAAVLLSGPIDNATAMGLTLEPAGGSAHPTTTPLTLMRLPTV